MLSRHWIHYIQSISFVDYDQCLMLLNLHYEISVLRIELSSILLHPLYSVPGDRVGYRRYQFLSGCARYEESPECSGIEKKYLTMCAWYGILAELSKRDNHLIHLEEGCACLPRTSGVPR
jgi:hypothetical protein